MEDKTKPKSSPSDTAIDIDVASENHLISSLKRLSYESWGGSKPLLLQSAGTESCCIFRIPDSLAEVNPTAYKPKVVSIGPYHYGEKHLRMIQQHKIRFLQLFADKARMNGIEESVLYKAVSDLEGGIRFSYSEELIQDGFDLVPMMILDGCFILMLLLIVSGNIELDDKMDPIFTIPWILPSIQSDLILLENQVPFFVLQTLFETSKMGFSGDLNRMAFDFFDYSIDKPERYWEKHRNLEARHLLDLIRMTFIPTTRSMGESEDFQLIKRESVRIPSSELTSQLILSAKRLRLQGIKFRLRSDADSILDIRLQNNRLQIPLLRLDGFISSIFLNCVAFEQFYTKSSNHITSYVVFMGCLLNGEEDATFLSNDKRIIENYFGNENEIAQFFKTICKDVVFDIRRSYLWDVFDGVNQYTSKWYNGVWAGFRHTHYESPWTCLSSSAVVFVILLTMLQATVAILSFLHDKKGDGNAAPPLGLP